MTPGRVCDLLCELADEALESARAAWTAATNPAARKELVRFVRDSQMYVLATRALRHKVGAAILKAQMRRASSTDLAGEFLRHTERSVEAFEDLAQLTDQTYRNTDDLMCRHWKRKGLTEFRNDQATQRAWLTALTQPTSVTLPGGAARIEAEVMGEPWRVGNDRYTASSGTGYVASYYAAVRPNAEPMTTKVHSPKAGKYTVWVRALVGGLHQDRALAVEVADQRLEPTHTARASADGEFLWERAGEVRLPGGASVIRICPVGKRHSTADTILLTPDADWKPQNDVDTNKRR